MHTPCMHKSNTDLPFILWLGLLAPWPHSCLATGCATREPWLWHVALPESLDPMAMQ